MPSDGTQSKNRPVFAAAVSSISSGWTGANLYVEQGTSLVPLGLATRETATTGTLTLPLTGSPSLYLEKDSTIELDLLSADLELRGNSLASLANGANRLYVDGEIIQYLNAEQTGARSWRLSGLLRGRGGTEHLANRGHPAGAVLIGLDDAILPVDPQMIAFGGMTRLAAIGLGDDDPVFATLVSTGVSLAPPAPVHSSLRIAKNGDWEIFWTRRARGQSRWTDHVDAPLVEESESYIVGVGSHSFPVATWQTFQPTYRLTASIISDLVLNHGSAELWVRQIGTYGMSPPTHAGWIS